jgi:hypothetical protein
MTEHAPFIESMLGGAADQVEHAAREGRIDLYTVGRLTHASILLQCRSAAERARRIEDTVPIEALYPGIITNIELPPPPTVRKPPRMESLEAEFPPYDRNRLLARFRREAASNRSFALAIEGRFVEARQEAEGQHSLHDLGPLLAILGHFDEAARIDDDPNLMIGRRGLARQIIAHELLRRGQRAVLASRLRELEVNGPNPNLRIDLALVVAGRTPWGGYPFADW